MRVVGIGGGGWSLEISTRNTIIPGVLKFGITCNHVMQTNALSDLPIS
jgi:hypothetical protein